MKSFTFLISTGRTGTKFFTLLFKTLYPDSVVYHTSEYTRILNIAGNMWNRGLLPKKTVHRLWKTLKYKNISSTKRMYFENNPYYYCFIDTIDQLLPDVKFIIIVRNPRSFINSHLNWERHRLRSKVANCCIPFWQPISYKEQLKGIQKNNLQRVKFYSKLWQRKNSVILNLIKEKHNVKVIKFENVFNAKNGLATIQSMLEWLELPYLHPLNTEMINSKVNMSRTGSFIWNDNCEMLMKNYCGSLMERLNYQ